MYAACILTLVSVNVMPARTQRSASASNAFILGGSGFKFGSCWLALAILVIAFSVISGTLHEFLTFKWFNEILTGTETENTVATCQLSNVGVFERLRLIISSFRAMVRPCCWLRLMHLAHTSAVTAWIGRQFLLRYLDEIETHRPAFFRALRFETSPTCFRSCSRRSGAIFTSSIFLTTLKSISRMSA